MVSEEDGGNGSQSWISISENSAFRFLIIYDQYIAVIPKIFEDLKAFVFCEADCFKSEIATILRIVFFKTALCQNKR